MAAPIPEAISQAESTKPQASPAGNKPNRKANKKRNAIYALLHKDPLPLNVCPLPMFHPTQPLSLVLLVWTYFRQLVSPPSSHVGQSYIGHYSPHTRSVNITDPVHIRALWEKGFFGKGTLSRSEPTWLEREIAQQTARRGGGQTAEEATRARREERRLFKLERARLEREKIDKQISIEQGTWRGENDESISQTLSGDTAVLVEKPLATEFAPSATNPTTNLVTEMRNVDAEADTAKLDTNDLPPIINQEHLQLTLEEAFFLKYALGVLQIRTDAASSISSNIELFDLFRKSSSFASASLTGMDDQFTLNYVVYHHFRSLGWVIRPGVKFSVDYLLYNRGPVFSHAEFAILIMPAYSHEYWKTNEGLAARRVEEKKDWWWLHCISRVQSQVKKTLVLCYVDIPPPQPIQDGNVTAWLKRYKVREFAVRRWLMNRSRD